MDKLKKCWRFFLEIFAFRTGWEEEALAEMEHPRRKQVRYGAVAAVKPARQMRKAS